MVGSLIANAILFSLPDQDEMGNDIEVNQDIQILYPVGTIELLYDKSSFLIFYFYVFKVTTILNILYKILFKLLSFYDYEEIHF